MHDKSALCRVITEYKTAARTAISHGEVVENVIGPPKIDVSAFLSLESVKDFNEQLPRVDRWASLMNLSFEDVDMFVRLGNIYLQWCLMRVSTISSSLFCYFY